MLPGATAHVYDGQLDKGEIVSRMGRLGFVLERCWPDSEAGAFVEENCAFARHELALMARSDCFAEEIVGEYNSALEAVLDHGYTNLNGATLGKLCCSGTPSQMDMLGCWSPASGRTQEACCIERYWEKAGLLPTGHDMTLGEGKHTPRNYKVSHLTHAKLKSSNHECWSQVYKLLPEELQDSRRAMEYCCAYRHVESCWGQLAEDTMVFDESLGVYLDFTHNYSTCCFEALRTQQPDVWMLQEIMEDFNHWQGRVVPIGNFDKLMLGEFAYQTDFPRSTASIHAHRELVDSVPGAQWNDDLRLCRFQVAQGKLSHCDLDLMPKICYHHLGCSSEAIQRHPKGISIDQSSTYSQLYMLVQAIVILSLNWNLPDMIFYVSEGDFDSKHWPVPILAISKHVNAPSAIRIGSHYVLHPFHRRKQHEIALLRRQALPLCEREPRLYFWGAMQGCWRFDDCPANASTQHCPGCRIVDLHDMDQQPRFRLLLLATLLPGFLDVRGKHPANPEVAQFFAERGALYSKYDSNDFIKEHLSKRYVLSIDGVANADREWLFFLGACPFVQQSPIVAYSTSKGLVPWVHYVPVRYDLSVLVEQIVWARQHQERCEEISSSALEFAGKAYMPEIASLHLLHVLRTYAMLQFNLTNP
jgi:hypothetical protein